ncbi:hypothetical protein CU307_06760 [Prochlorococcus marinus str. MU1411]|nr:hypothetical protein [Prochlorococcus marinus str. MU1411]
MNKTLYNIFIKLKINRRKQLNLLLLISINIVISEKLNIAEIGTFLLFLNESYKLLKNQLYKFFTIFFNILSKKEIILLTTIPIQKYY